MNLLQFRSAAFSVFALSFASLSVNAAVMPLEARLSGLAYYDPNLNITWAANANMNGQDNWINQSGWAASLNIGGVTGWRLPNADVNGDLTVVNCFDGGVPGCSDNEMGFLFYEEGISAATPGPFSNIVSGLGSNGAPNVYWSSTENFPGSNSAQTFDFDLGGNGSGHITLADYIFAWPVHDGNVGVVPIPAAVWLFGSALLGLLGLKRRAA